MITVGVDIGSISTKALALVDGRPAASRILPTGYHAGRAADPALGRAFIAAAARLLAPKGTLWLVANRHLPYEHALRETFRTVSETGGETGFKILCATHPKKQS